MARLTPLSRPALAAGLAALVSVAALAPATAVAAPTTTTTPSSSAPAAAPAAAPVAADQFAWVVAASGRAPVPAEELQAHFTPAFVTSAGGLDAVNRVLASVGPLTPDYTVRATATTHEAVVTGPRGRYVTTLALDESGRVATFVLSARLPAPTSWSAVDEQLRALAPRVSFATDRITADGTCAPVHQVDADTPRPLGSAFKLYVLGALGDAVAAATASWDEELAIRDAWKSLPSGVLQDEPAGTRLTLQQYANYMISISDNTATDHLIHRLGAPAVEQQLVRFGNSQPALTTPFPTTRQFFTLKAFGHPYLADAYAASPPPVRRAELEATAAVPLSALTAWSEPRRIDELEWFASAHDMCRAFSGLWQQARTPGLAPVGQALSLNDGGLGLDPAEHPVVWFKGGSEPGVLTLTYLTQAADGGLLVTSVQLSDTTAPIDEAAAAPRALAVVRGATALAG